MLFGVDFSCLEPTNLCEKEEIYCGRRVMDKRFSFLRYCHDFVLIYLLRFCWKTVWQNNSIDTDSFQPISDEVTLFSIVYFLFLDICKAILIDIQVSSFHDRNAASLRFDILICRDVNASSFMIVSW